MRVTCSIEMEDVSSSLAAVIPDGRYLFHSGIRHSQLNEPNEEDLDRLHGKRDECILNFLK